MSGNYDVCTLTITPLQLILIENALSIHIMREQRDLKRWPIGSLEHNDIEHSLSALHDLRGTILNRNDHTLAALKLIAAELAHDSHLAEVDYV